MLCGNCAQAQPETRNQKTVNEPRATGTSALVCNEREAGPLRTILTASWGMSVHSPAADCARAATGAFLYAHSLKNTRWSLNHMLAVWDMFIVFCTFVTVDLQARHH
jgi:hypothetical protein